MARFSKTRRRRFSADYKQKILEEADGCSGPEELKALLQRESLRPSYLSKWREHQTSKITEESRAVDASREARLRILAKELELSTQTYMGALKDYRQQITAVNIYITLLGGFFVILISNLDRVMAKPEMLSYVLMMLLPFSSLTILYFMAHITDVVTNIYLLEARNGVAEKKLNNLIGETLTWDSKVIPFYNREFFQAGGWINSSYTLGLWMVVFVLALLTIHLFLAYTLVTSLIFRYVFTATLLACTSFVVVQYALLQWTGATQIERMVLRLSGFEVKPIPQVTDLSIVGIFTFIFGFLSFLIISVSEKFVAAVSFWLLLSSSVAKDWPSSPPSS